MQVLDRYHGIRLRCSGSVKSADNCPPELIPYQRMPQNCGTTLVTKVKVLDIFIHNLLMKTVVAMIATARFQSAALFGSEAKSTMDSGSGAGQEEPGSSPLAPNERHLWNCLVTFIQVHTLLRVRIEACLSPSLPQLLNRRFKSKSQQPTTASKRALRLRSIAFPPSRDSGDSVPEGCHVVFIPTSCDIKPYPDDECVVIRLKGPETV